MLEFGACANKHVINMNMTLRGNVILLYYKPNLKKTSNNILQMDKTSNHLDLHFKLIKKYAVWILNGLKT